MKETNIEVVAVQPSPSIKAVQELPLSGLGRRKDGQDTKEPLAKVVGFVQIPVNYSGPVALAEKENIEITRQKRREYWLYKENLKKEKAGMVVGTREWFLKTRLAPVDELIACIERASTEC